MKVGEQMKNAKEDIHETITKYRLTHAEAIAILAELIREYAIEADMLCKEEEKRSVAG